MGVYLEFDQFGGAVHHVFEVGAGDVAVSGDDSVYVGNVFPVEYVAGFGINPAQEVVHPLLEKAQRLQSVNGIGIFAALVDDLVDGPVQPVKGQPVSVGGGGDKIPVQAAQIFPKFLKIVQKHFYTVPFLTVYAHMANYARFCAKSFSFITIIIIISQPFQKAPRPHVLERPPPHYVFPEIQNLVFYQYY